MTEEQWKDAFLDAFYNEWKNTFDVPPDYDSDYPWGMYAYDDYDGYKDRDDPEMAAQTAFQYFRSDIGQYINEERDIQAGRIPHRKASKPHYKLDIDFKFSKNQDWSDEFPEYATLEEAERAAEETMDDLKYDDPVDDRLLGSDLPDSTNLYTYDYFDVSVWEWDNDTDTGICVYRTRPAVIELVR